MGIKEQINAFKDKIAKDKQKVAILKGREQENLKQLAEHGLKSLVEAEKWLIKRSKEISKKEDDLSNEFEVLKKEMLAVIRKAYKVDSDEEAEQILFGGE